MKKRMPHVIGIFLWVGIWFLSADFLKGTIPFADPWDTILELKKLAATSYFWTAIGNTLLGICSGFLSALLIGTILAYLAYYYNTADAVLVPFITFLSYIPMVTFTLVTVLWSKGSILAYEVCMFLSIPTIFKHTLQGLRNGEQAYLHPKDKDLPWYKKLNYIYRPATMPEYLTGCHRAINMCFKSGIIAQLLGHTKYSIGNFLLEAKDNLNVAGIFAWTFVIIMLNLIFEQIVIRVLSLTVLNAGAVDVESIFERLEEEEEENI